MARQVRFKPGNPRTDRGRLAEYFSLGPDDRGREHFSVEERLPRDRIPRRGFRQSAEQLVPERCCRCGSLCIFTPKVTKIAPMRGIRWG